MHEGRVLARGVARQVTAGTPRALADIHTGSKVTLRGIRLIDAVMQRAHSRVECVDGSGRRVGAVSLEGREEGR
jgi:hypothetical protein